MPFSSTRSTPRTGASATDTITQVENVYGSSYGDRLVGTSGASAERLAEATLDGADMRNADLRGASLREASLRGAKLHGVPVLDCHYGTSNGHYAIKIDQLLTSSHTGWLGDRNAA